MTHHLFEDMTFRIPISSLRNDQNQDFYTLYVTSLLPLTFMIYLSSMFFYAHFIVQWILRANVGSFLRIFLVLEANWNLRSTVFGFVFTVAGPPILKPQFTMLELETVVEVLEWTKYKRSLWSLQLFTQCSDLKLASMFKVVLALLVSATPKTGLQSWRASFGSYEDHFLGHILVGLIVKSKSFTTIWGGTRYLTEWEFKLLGKNIWGPYLASWSSNLFEKRDGEWEKAQSTSPTTRFSHWNGPYSTTKLPWFL